MNACPRVLVLMTTYNGQDYVAEQIESILSQRDVEVTLRISDDRSSDGTYRILEGYADSDDRVHISLNSRNLGCNANFMQLIHAADASAYDFFAISDQDDVWHPDKLAIAASHISANTSRPELYYAGVNNVTSDGVLLGNEYEQYRKVAAKPLSLLLVQNWALGCTTLFNAPLLKLLQSYEGVDFGRVYDAWIHAVCLYCGGYVYGDLSHCHIDRRITGRNLMGLMNERRSPLFIARRALAWFFKRDAVRATKHTKMACCLMEGFEQHMDAQTARIVDAVAGREFSAACRWRLFTCKGIIMPTAARTAWLKLMVLFNRF